MFTISNPQNPFSLCITENTIVHYIMYTQETHFRLPYTLIYLCPNPTGCIFPQWTWTSDENTTSGDISTLTTQAYAIMKHSAPYINTIIPQAYVTEKTIQHTPGVSKIWVFYEITWTTQEAQHIDPYNCIHSPIPVLLWELRYPKYTCGIPIHTEVIQTISLHTDITDDNENIQEQEQEQEPHIGYTFHTKKDTPFAAMFGTSRDYNGLLGDWFYYFTNFTKSTQTNMGIVRYVIDSTNTCNNSSEFVSSGIDTLVYMDKYGLLVTKSASMAIPISYHYI